MSKQKVKYFLTDAWDLTLGVGEMMAYVLIPLSGIALVLWGIVWSANTIDRETLRTTCSGFSEASHRETKFVEYSYWSRDCLTPQKDGKWISTTLLRAESEQ